ncbi:MAG TPA: DedA family protein [Nocardioidaceae bacterium]|nr:DedA family protein [Nocardioidaceae bacterium]
MTWAAVPVAVSVAASAAAGTSTDSEELGGIAGWAVDLMETLGGPGAGVAIALENLFPPLPSEVILPAAGFTASQGDFTLGGAIFWTTLGSVVGALVLYWLGALLGARRMRLIAVRLPLVKLDDVTKSEEWFARHGGKAVFFGRMVPIFRSFISIPAGIERMPLLRFLLLTTAGSLIWNTIFVLAGYTLGENWHQVEAWVSPVSNLVIIAVLVAVAYFVGSRLFRRWRDRQPG